MTLPDPRPAAHRADGDDSARGVAAGRSAGAAIARAVVSAVAAATGRGPRSARAHGDGDVVTVVLRDLSTALERTLLAQGRSDVVIEARRAMQQTIEPALVEQVELATGARVLATLFDVQPAVDVASMTFVLDRSGAPELERRSIDRTGEPA